jgi:muramoyltetrapeptide carboxypeptidase
MTTALVRPPRLRPGDLVAIVNPSLALPGAPGTTMLEPAVRGLEAAGLRVRIMPHVGERWTSPEAPQPALAGSDEARADDFNTALRDPAVRMLVTAWGGGGADRLLRTRLIDWAALAADPKLLCGFSDFSHLGLAALRQAGVVTIDGPSAGQWAAGPDEPMLAQALRVLTEPRAAGLLPAAPEWYATQLPPGGSGPATRARPGGTRTLRPGTARARLVATLPNVLLTLVELGLAPSLVGAIWCLDSYRAQPAQVAEWLEALHAHGVLDGLAGLVVARPWPSSTSPQGPSLDDVLLATTAELRPAPPVLADADTGHTWPKWTLPNGVLAELDSAAGRLMLLEPAVT